MGQRSGTVDPATVSQVAGRLRGMELGIESVRRAKLVALTDITGVSPGASAITANVGFAIIFGFAIRRTLGLLDIIKRIFPNPAPAS